MTPLAFLVIILFVFSVIIHEVSHGLAALYFGDDTAYLKGRLSLDPIKHIDPVWTILIPVVMYMTSGIAFGGAKPVPVNPHRFKNPRKNMMWVAAAGPASNIALAIIFALGFHLSVYLAPMVNQESLTFFMQKALVQIIIINLFLAFFNLIPIPPLDGGRIVTGLLPYDLALKYQRLEQFGMMILIGLIATGATSLVIIPVEILAEPLLGFPIKLR